MRHKSESGKGKHTQFTKRSPNLAEYRTSMNRGSATLHGHGKDGILHGRGGTLHGRGGTYHGHRAALSRLVLHFFFLGGGGAGSKPAASRGANWGPDFSISSATVQTAPKLGGGYPRVRPSNGDLFGLRNPPWRVPPVALLLKTAPLAPGTENGPK